jgi:hypothetical protein
MNIKWGFILLLTGLAYLLTTASYAANALAREELELLISGNTAEGQNVEWKESMTWYFHKLGQIKKIDDKGNKGKGKWFINEKAELCIEFKRGGERCRTVIPREDGGYDVYGTASPESGKLVWTFQRILAGNAHDL